MTRTLTVAAIMLAAITTAPAADDPLYGWAAITTYHSSCGYSVPEAIRHSGAAYLRSRAVDYDEQLAVVQKQKQELGVEQFCATMRTRLEPAFPDMLSKAKQAGFGLDGQDVEKILATYKANALRFERDYLGRPLEITWPFKTATETYAEFGTGAWSGNVQCELRPEQMDTVIEFNRGQKVQVQGTISGTSWTGDLKLKDCTMSPAPTAARKSASGR